MKLALSTLALMTAIFAATAHALNIKARDGRTYRDIVITGVEPDGARVYYRDGITTLDWRDFPAPVQKQFHYDAARGRRNPKAAAQEAFDACQRAFEEAQRAEAERLAAIQQVEQERKAEEEQRRRAEELQARADAEARLRADEDFQQRERDLREREQALQTKLAAAANPAPLPLTPKPSQPSLVIRDAPSAPTPHPAPLTQTARPPPGSYYQVPLPETYPTTNATSGGGSPGIVVFLIGAVIAIAFFANRPTKAANPSEQPRQPQLSPWQRAFSPAIKAAKWGGIVGTLSVFRVQSGITFGDRIFLAMVFSIAIALLLAVPVYLIAALAYYAKEH